MRKLLFSPTAKNTYTLFAGNLLDAMLAFGFTLVVYRVLNTSDFGVFSALNNFLFTAALVLDLGIGQALLHFVPVYPDRARQYITAGVWLRAGVATAVAAILILTAGWIGPGFFATRQIWAVIWTAVAVVGTSVVEILVYSLQGQRQFLRSVAVANLFTLSRFGLAVVAWKSGWPFSMVVAAMINAVSPVISLIVGAAWNRILPMVRPDKTMLKQLAGFGGWLGLAKIATTIATRLDIQIVLLLVGSTAAGVYSVAARLTNFYVVIWTSLMAILATRLAVTGPEFVKKAAVGVGGLLIAMGIGIVIAKPLIMILFGAKAAGSVGIFQGLTAAYMPFMAAILPMSILIYRVKKPKLAGIFSLAQLAIMLIANLILTPRLGTSGPIISLAIANSFLFLISVFYMR